MGACTSTLGRRGLREGNGDKLCEPVLRQEEVEESPIADSFPDITASKLPPPIVLKLPEEVLEIPAWRNSKSNFLGGDGSNEASSGTAKAHLAGLKILPWGTPWSSKALYNRLSSTESKEMSGTHSLTFAVKCASGISASRFAALFPKEVYSVRGASYVKASLFDTIGNPRPHTSRSSCITLENQVSTLIFNFSVEMKQVELSDIIELSLWFRMGPKTAKIVGKTEITVAEFTERDEWPEFWLFAKNAAPMFDRSLKTPITLSIGSIKILQVDSDTVNEPFSNSDIEFDSNASTKVINSEDDQSKGISSTSDQDYSASYSDQDYSASYSDRPSCLNPYDSYEFEYSDESDSFNEMSKPIAEDLALETPAMTNDGAQRTPVHKDLCIDRITEDKCFEPAAHQHSGEVISQVSETEDTTVKLSANVDERTVGSSDDTISNSSHKHILVITRGTRGDVQPFVALARGLAENLGWTVTICTELRYRALIRKYSKVTAGSIHFRPSGGDTERRIETPICKWAMRYSQNKFIHTAISARSEREFFDSEPAFFYWAKRLQPDIICYTFTTANLGLIISEALKIPCLGFFLQPMVLPSSSTSAIASLTHFDEDSSEGLTPSSTLESHSTVRLVKHWFENNVFTSRLRNIRRLRGLDDASWTENDLDRLISGNYPLIMPIKSAAFGNFPNDWPKNFTMTDFIFLRNKKKTNPPSELISFLETARKDKQQLICICFSSMPISRSKILEIALLILDHCPEPYRPAVVALVGYRSLSETVVSSLKERSDKYIADQRLLILQGAPFDYLFPRMDFIITHGGVGSTAEALAAGKPCMVTGVLLLDQRFWGRRVWELGVAPPPCHIKKLNDVIIPILPQVLDPNGSMVKRAKEVQSELFPGGLENMSDGVEVNVRAVEEASKLVFDAVPPENTTA